MISHLIVNHQAIKPKHKANHYLALRLLDALNGKRVDWNVAGLVARERHLAALLVALRDLLTVWGPKGVLTNRSLAAEVSKVPHTIIQTGDNVGLPAAFSSESECPVFASKKEIGLVFGIVEVSIVGTRKERWFSTVNPVLAANPVFLSTAVESRQSCNQPQPFWGQGGESFQVRVLLLEGRTFLPSLAVQTG